MFANSVSFVAVTQQFNTTTSMGRLTLNILLSFAQFERELASERVKDKIAASRRKGKWTGGTPPLGYDARNKKLAINKTEAQTVRTIFQLYLEVKSFGRLVSELDRRHIVTKRRDTKVAKYRGGIPFTYGPLAHLLKNRIYLGEVHHGGKWFKGEHDGIVDREIFDQVQHLLKQNGAQRGNKFSDSGALLKGKLFDDKGNRMVPTFSSKRGVRYRFYISTALRGRKEMAGSVTRISAAKIEDLVEFEVRKELRADHTAVKAVLEQVQHVTLASGTIQIVLANENSAKRPIEIEWSPRPISHAQIRHAKSGANADPKLVGAIARARGWLDQLSNGAYDSIAALAAAEHYNPKVIRLGLRLAFLAPELTEAVVLDTTDFKLQHIPKTLPLSWRDQRRALG